MNCCGPIVSIENSTSGTLLGAGLSFASLALSRFASTGHSRLAVDGRIVIVALYQIHIVGVRAIFPRFHRNLVPLWS